MPRLFAVIALCLLCSGAEAHNFGFSLGFAGVAVHGGKSGPADSGLTDDADIVLLTDDTGAVSLVGQ